MGFDNGVRSSYVTIVLWASLAAHLAAAPQGPVSKPNILLAIADDQSWLHASAYGCGAVRTPAFDRVARAGVLFNNCYGASPGCSPCRAALLTGRHTWMIEEAGTHASSFPTKYVTYPDILEKDGYFIGYTGKGWGPGDWKISGRARNPAGPEFSKVTIRPPYKGISKKDYAGNFAEFLKGRPKGQPFCFWYGATEPHRGYEKGSGLKSGKSLADVVVPPFLPDVSEIRSDILDYLVEIEWFDSHLGRMLDMLERAGELENTLVIVTSDNGMPFPRGKANCYEYGCHMPLAIAWPARVAGGRAVDDLVGFVDLTATMLDAAGVEHPHRNDKALAPAGRSIMNILASGKGGIVDPTRQYIYAARERHSSSRYNNWTYPERCVRSRDFLYVRNFKPERWPAGDPQELTADGTPGPMHGAYRDIDSGPSLEFLVSHREDRDISRFFHLAVDKRPSEELFDIRKDPGCLNNLASDPAHGETLRQMRERLKGYLRETGDPRALGNGEIWESYPRYSPIRKFPGP